MHNNDAPAPAANSNDFGDAPDAAANEPFSPLPAELLETALAGDSGAQFQIGELYSNAFAPFYCRTCGGLVSPEQIELDICPDCGAKYPFTKAITWYESAAKRGNAAAMVRLHVACFFGIGTRRNEGRAKEFFKNARLIYPAIVHPPTPPFLIGDAVEPATGTVPAAVDTAGTASVAADRPAVPKIVPPKDALLSTFHWIIIGIAWLAFCAFVFYLIIKK